LVRPFLRLQGQYVRTGLFSLSCFGLISNFLTILVPFRYEPRSCPLACWSFRLDGQVRERFGAPRSWSGSLTISPASGEDSVGWADPSRLPAGVSGSRPSSRVAFLVKTDPSRLPAGVSGWCPKHLAVQRRGFEGGQWAVNGGRRDWLHPLSVLIRCRSGVPVADLAKKSGGKKINWQWAVGSGQWER
jgi:hypothetical protein